MIQTITACVLLLLSPMNMNESRSKRTVEILNHVALAFCFGSMVADTIKMVFVQDYVYDGRRETTTTPSEEF